MKVGTRITAATSTVVILSLGVILLLVLPKDPETHKEEVLGQAKLLVQSLQSIVQQKSEETLKSVIQNPPPIREGWKVRLYSIQNLHENSAQLRRLEKVVNEELKEPLISETHDPIKNEKRIICTLPLYSAEQLSEQTIIGSIEVSKSISGFHDQWNRELQRILVPLITTVIFTFFVITLFIRSLVTNPIKRLISGMDDVTEGDLNRVVMAEREDEIGDLATRFNQMIFSIRENRNAINRQNQAKLQLEQKLGQTEKQTTMDHLAAEIAHEIGTPLNVITGRARSIERKVENNPTVMKNAKIIGEQSARIARIIERLLTITRRRAGTALQPISINEITLTTMEVLEEQFNEARIRATLDRAEGLPSVQGNGDRIQQVLLNLLLNGIQATPPGGKIRMETTLVTRRRPGLELSPPHDYVSIEVTDTGKGIPTEHLDEVFEPFFTTKKKSDGTGLGLAISTGIVKEHDGWIELESTEGKGTSIKVFLPAIAYKITPKKNS